MHSVLPAQEICLSIQITPTSSQINLQNSTCFLTWAQMLSLSTKHGQRSTKYHLCPYETPFLCIMLMEHGTPLAALPTQWSWLLNTKDIVRRSRQKSQTWKEHIYPGILLAKVPQSRYWLDQQNSKNDTLPMTLPYASAEVSLHFFSRERGI